MIWKEKTFLAEEKVACRKWSLNTFWKKTELIHRRIFLSTRVLISVQPLLHFPVGRHTIEFEPSATALEAENSGYVVASLGVDSGYVPYTAYSAKTSYLNANPNIIQKFTNALQKGMDFVQSHTPEEIAKVIAPQFKETDLATITTIVSRYYEQDTWKSDLIFNEESFNLLQDILENSGELKERVPYEELVTTTFAEKAAH